MSSSSSTSSTNDDTPHTTFNEEWPQQFDTFSVAGVCNFDDNYAYIILDKATNEAAFVDPAEPEKVLAAFKTTFPKATLKAIFTTHKHYDHAGGNSYFREHYPDVAIYGGVRDSVEGCTNPVSSSSPVLTLGSSTRIRVLDSACHTQGHVLYLVNDDKALFSGDTLFAAGCGKFFEGDAAQMHHNLSVTIGTLGGACRVFCGHEYTTSNLEFAAFIEPNNETVKEKLAWCRRRRGQGLPCIPTSIDEEKLINPFMRVLVDEVVSRVRSLGVSGSTPSSAVDILGSLRELKNQNAHKKAAAL